MVVWGYPCESKSSPAHYSKHPQLTLGVFFYAKKYIKNKSRKRKGNINKNSMLSELFGVYINWELFDVVETCINIFKMKLI